MNAAPGADHAHPEHRGSPVAEPGIGDTATGLAFAAVIAA
jgi:hypothetical protein